MDSTNPFSQSPSNFIALLSSQQEHVELFSSPMRNESVEIPLYSTQSAAPRLPEEAPEERRGRRKWTPIEDVVLISSWLNTSKDAVVGNEQKAEAFWKRITEYIFFRFQNLEAEKQVRFFQGSVAAAFSERDKSLIEV